MTIALERSAAEAWPAVDLAIVAGWTCRSAAGYTQRANSCLPLESPGADHVNRIPLVENYFVQKNLPAVFKLPEHPAWEALDEALAQRAYTVATPSRVLSKSAGSPSVSPAFQWQDTFDAAWWAGYAPASGLAEVHLPTAKALSLRVARPIVARVTQGGEDCAWAFASLVGRDAWIFDVVVNPSHRRQGLGRILMDGLEAEATRQGTKNLHLQVLTANLGANALYEALRYSESYRYHYRRSS